MKPSTYISELISRSSSASLANPACVLQILPCRSIITVIGTP